MSYEDGKIEVGMMVEVMDHPKFVTGRQYLGKRGIVSKASWAYPDSWLIEGMSNYGHTLSFAACHLRPIPQDSKTRETEQPCEDYFLTYLKDIEKRVEGEKV